MTHPYRVFEVRSMLAVPYFEKALYEIKEDELSPELLYAIADKVEQEIIGGPSSRTLLSVPHILDCVSCCYYHGYVLAEMSVQQTRKHFIDTLGYLTDNPMIGPELLKEYWLPGNTACFLDLVKNLTGKTLEADAWIHMLATPVESLVESEKRKYQSAIGKHLDVDLESLDLHLRLVHGDVVVADSETDGGFSAACGKYKNWIKHLNQ